MAGSSQAEQSRREVAVPLERMLHRVRSGESPQMEVETLTSELWDLAHRAFGISQSPVDSFRDRLEEIDARQA